MFPYGKDAQCSPRYTDQSKLRYYFMPSLGLRYLAAVARQAGHTVEILNCLKERMTYEGFDDLLRFSSYDVVGFQTFSYDLNSVKRHLSIVRARLPRAVTVAGGAHPSGDPVGTLTYLSELDFAFQGEAETGCAALGADDHADTLCCHPCV